MVTSTRFRSKVLVYVIVFSFLTLITTESLPANFHQEDNDVPVVRVKMMEQQISSAQKEKFERYLEEGKRFYSDMEYESAVQKLNEAKDFAQTKDQKSDLYFYLSLARYAMIEIQGNEEFINTVTNIAPTFGGFCTN